MKVNHHLFISKIQIQVDVHNMSEFFKQLAVMTTNVYLSINQTIELNDKVIFQTFF